MQKALGFESLHCLHLKPTGLSQLTHLCHVSNKNRHPNFRMARSRKEAVGNTKQYLVLISPSYKYRNISYQPMGYVWYWRGSWILKSEVMYTYTVIRSIDVDLLLFLMTICCNILSAAPKKSNLPQNCEAVVSWNLPSLEQLVTHVPKSSPTNSWIWVPGPYYKFHGGFEITKHHFGSRRECSDVWTIGHVTCDHASMCVFSPFVFFWWGGKTTKGYER